MRLSRFFTERKNLTINSSVKLQDDDIRHIRNALRLKQGDQIVLFNGEKEYLAELKLVRKEFITAQILKVLKSEIQTRESVEITLILSLLRALKFDFVVEKATELGVNNIVPIETDHSQVKIAIAQKRFERWRKITIAAAQQSSRITLPEILDPMKFEDLINLKDNFDVIYLFTLKKSTRLKSLVSEASVESRRDGVQAKKVAVGPMRVGFVIGPEGGFSPKELKLAKEWGFEFVTLGDSILKSETAAIAFLSILKYIYSEN